MSGGKKWIDKELLSVETDEGKLSLFRLSLPIFLNMISSLLISFVQTIAARRYMDGFLVVPITIAATGFSFLQTIVMLIGTGAAILLSAYLGRKAYDDCKKIVGTSLILSLIFALAVALIGLAASGPLLKFMGMNKEEYAVYQPHALAIFKWRMAELVVWSVGNDAISCLRCYGHTKIGFIAGLATNVVNIAGVVFSLFVLKIPAESAVLALSLISVASSVVFTAIGLVFLRVKKIPAAARLDRTFTKKIFQVGVPAGISQIFYSLSQIVTTSICTRLPQAAYLAKTYLQQITQFVYKFGYSIGQANAIIVGRLCGMGDPERADRIHRQDLKIVLLCNMALSVLCMIFGRSFLRLFFGADESILAFSFVFVIDIAVEFGRGMNHVGENGLNATGDVRFTTICSIASCWVFSVGLSYLFVAVLGWSLYGMWIAFAVDELFRGTAYLIRWKKQGWKKEFEKMMAGSARARSDEQAE